LGCLFSVQPHVGWTGRFDVVRVPWRQDVHVDGRQKGCRVLPPVVHGHTRLAIDNDFKPSLGAGEQHVSEVPERAVNGDQFIVGKRDHCRRHPGCIA